MTSHGWIKFGHIKSKHEYILASQVPEQENGYSIDDIVSAHWSGRKLVSDVSSLELTCTCCNYLEVQIFHSIVAIQYLSSLRVRERICSGFVVAASIVDGQLMGAQHE